MFRQLGYVVAFSLFRLAGGFADAGSRCWPRSSWGVAKASADPSSPPGPAVPDEPDAAPASVSKLRRVVRSAPPPPSPAGWTGWAMAYGRLLRPGAPLPRPHGGRRGVLAPWDSPSCSVPAHRHRAAAAHRRGTRRGRHQLRRKGRPSRSPSEQHADSSKRSARGRGDAGHPRKDGRALRPGRAACSRSSSRPASPSAIARIEEVARSSLRSGSSSRRHPRGRLLGRTGRRGTGCCNACSAAANSSRLEVKIRGSPTSDRAPPADAPPSRRN